MKNFGEEAMAAIAAGTAIVGGACEIACDPPVRVFSGEGSIASTMLRGLDAPFTGISHHGLAQIGGGGLGSAARKLTLSLSGVDPKVLELIDAEELARAPVTLWRLISDASGTRLLSAIVFDRGRVDTLDREEVSGGTATISIAVEGSARGNGRRTARMRTDADQRLVDADDGGLSRVSYAGEKALYFGGKPPERAGVALR